MGPCVCRLKLSIGGGGGRVIAGDVIGSPTSALVCDVACD